MRRRTIWIVVALAVSLLVAASMGGSIEPPPLRPTPRRWSADDLTIAYVGHASVLINFQGTVILTDPTFFDRIGVSVGGVTLGVKRIVAPAVMPEDLPPIDAVVISHAHLDSLDRPSLRAVASAPTIVVPAKTADLVDDLGFSRVVELPWGESTQIGDVTIEAIEVQHWGRRWPWDAWRGYNGYLLSKGSLRVLFASDTAYTDAIGRVGRERGITAAILGNGSYDPWIANHANPEQVWRMFEESGACFLLPCHWDTFRLGKEPLGDSIARLLAAAGPEADRVVIRRIGETWTMPPGACPRS